MKNALVWVLSILEITLLPVAGWWIASRFIENPPLVAPFLFASPFLALTVACGFFARRFVGKRDLHRVPKTNRQVDEITERYPDLFEKYQGKVTCDSLSEAGVNTIQAVDGWLWVDSKHWATLSAAAREFALVETALAHKGSSLDIFKKHIYWSGSYLVGYILASINLWLIIPAHILWFGSFAWFALEWAPKQQAKLDALTLSRTRNLKGALDYLKAISRCGRSKFTIDRERALRDNASQMGLA